MIIKERRETNEQLQSYSSGKPEGGTEESTTVLNLGVGLARVGKRVLLVDCDPQGDLTICCGFSFKD